MGPGLFELVHLPILLVVVVLLLGPARLAKIGRYLGGKIKDFKKAMSKPRR
jgi:TatA/E family protein of Tat protein translocase